MSAENESRLAEYTALRNEITTRIKVQIDILAFMLGALAILFGVSLKYEFYEIYLIIPFLTLTAGFHYISSKARVVEISDYIREKIEKKVEGLEWENYQISDTHRLWSFNISDRIRSILIFIIPTIASIILFFSFKWNLMLWLSPLGILYLIIFLIYIIFLFILSHALYNLTRKRYQMK